MSFLLVILTRSDSPGSCHNLRVCKPYKGFFVIFVPIRFFYLKHSEALHNYGVFVSETKPNSPFIYFFQFLSRSLITEMPGLCTVIEMWNNKLSV